MKDGAEQKQKEIFLFRHGKTEANEKHLYCGKTDLPLSEKGRTELLEKKEFCVYPDISRCKVFTSGLLRTTQSLGILYPEVVSSVKRGQSPAEDSANTNEAFSPVGDEPASSKTDVFSPVGDDPAFIEEPSFQEIDFGDFEMKSYEELKNDERYKAWVEREVDRIQNVHQTEAENPCPNGESWLQMRNRVLSALENALKNYRSVAIFTHGGPISAIMAHFFPDERKSLYEWQSDFGEGYKITLDSSSSPSDFMISRASYEKIPAERCES